MVDPIRTGAPSGQSAPNQKPAFLRSTCLARRPDVYAAHQWFRVVDVQKNNPPSVPAHTHDNAG